MCECSKRERERANKQAPSRPTRFRGYKLLSIKAPFVKYLYTLEIFLVFKPLVDFSAADQHCCPPERAEKPPKTHTPVQKQRLSITSLWKLPLTSVMAANPSDESSSNSLDLKLMHSHLVAFTDGGGRSPLCLSDGSALSRAPSSPPVS